MAQTDPIALRSSLSPEFREYVRSLESLPLSQHNPENGVVAQRHPKLMPMFPVVDFHTHCFPLFGSWPAKDFMTELRKRGVVAAVNMVGYDGEETDRALAEAAECDGRLMIFGGIDFARGAEPGFAEYVVNYLREGKKKGIKGIKVYKEVGLDIRIDGRLVSPTDACYDVVWDTCGELDLPVLFHIADPMAFFRPLDEVNERVEELCSHPAWWFGGEGVPSFESLMDIQEQLIAAHPGTKFVSAHVGSSAEDLARVDRWLEKYPNYYVDIAARIAELGRQPYSARAFLIKWSKRIVFGTDTLGNECIYHPYYYQFLETMDEYIPYAPTFEQGHWNIYGVGLPEQTLRDIYYGTACTLIPALGPLVQAALKD